MCTMETRRRFCCRKKQVQRGLVRSRSFRDAMQRTFLLCVFVTSSLQVSVRACCHTAPPFVNQFGRLQIGGRANLFHRFFHFLYTARFLHHVIRWWLGWHSYALVRRTDRFWTYPKQRGWNESVYWVFLLWLLFIPRTLHSDGCLLCSGLIARSCMLSLVVWTRVSRRLWLTGRRCSELRRPSKVLAPLEHLCVFACARI